MSVHHVVLPLLVYGLLTSRAGVRREIRKELGVASEALENDHPLRAARIAQALCEDLEAGLEEAREQRRAAFRRMEEAFGWSHGDIAKEFKGALSRQRVSQIVNG